MIKFDGCLALSNRDCLPKSSGIYFFCDGEDVLYVGQSKNIWARWQNHERYRYAKHANDPKVRWQLASIDELDCLESNYINTLSPILNNTNAIPGKTTTFLTDVQKFHLRRIIKHTGLQQSEIIRRALDEYIKAFYAEIRDEKQQGEDRQD